MPLSKSGTVHDLFDDGDSISIVPKNSSASSITGLDQTIQEYDTLQKNGPPWNNYVWQMAGHSWRECAGDFPHLVDVLDFEG